MPTLTARTLITAIGSIAYPAIEIAPDGLIDGISSDPTIRSEAILTPTFLDIHIHGAAGFDVMTAPPAGLSRIQHFLARKGASHYLPTTVTASIDDTLRALAALADAIEAPTPGDEATPIGIHLEGPFLSHAKRGVHPTHLLQPPSIPLFDRFHQAARGHVRLLTIAPENPGAIDLIRHAVAQGVRVSLGHTNATAAQAEAAIAVGAASATHTFNAMRPLDHREPGVLGVVLDTPSLFAELICDGVHVAPALVRLWLRLKGERAILVTDAISATGMPDGPCTLAGLPVTVANGKAFLTDSPSTLAGSVLTLDRAVANLQAFTGCALEEAVRCASSHPAQMLGLADTIASLRVGQPANFNQYSPDGHLEATWLRGERLGRIDI
jgi:N-acetylglucosamine-6-phosphate deacetylase